MGNHCIAQDDFKFSYKKLQRPEKGWIICHPFVAKKAIRLTRYVLIETENISIELKLENISGGKKDAIRHALWMAILANEIGIKKARKLGLAHEKSNLIQFKINKAEEGVLPDSVSSVMDFINNKVGLEIINELRQRKSLKIDKADKKAYIRSKVIEKLYNGELAIINRDGKGNFLTCNNEIIDIQYWENKWNIPKCIIYTKVHNQLK